MESYRPGLSNLPPASCVTLDKWLTFSEPRSLIFEMSILLFFASGTTGAPV